LGLNLTLEKLINKEAISIAQINKILFYYLFQLFELQVENKTISSKQQLLNSRIETMLIDRFNYIFLNKIFHLLIFIKTFLLKIKNDQ
jgi:hypothetical protein